MGRSEIVPVADLSERCASLISELGIAAPEEITGVFPLPGGVASDIARVDLAGGRLCVKFALPRLKVAADWRAPVHRNAAEYAWLEVAAVVCPQSSLRLLGQSPRQHGFAMEYIEGADVYLWKTALLGDVEDQGEAALVGGLLGRIHKASVAGDFDRSAFHNRDDFRALRLEPYLNFTARANPAVRGILADLAEELYASEQVLVHGDVSPKNIMFRNAGPVLLDAECATLGDAAFDPSFCLNHLALKAIHLPRSRDRLLDGIASFWSAYSAFVSWEHPAQLEARVCRLLPALMLGRIDGKSPVDYLDERERDLVRAFAIDLVSSPAPALGSLIQRIATHMKKQVT